MKKISELDKDELIILGEDMLEIISVEQINNYRDEIINKGLKCYLAYIERQVDSEYIDFLVDDMSEYLQGNDELIEDEYLEPTEEEKEELYKIFNNMLSRTTDIYKRGEEVEVDIF